MQKLDILCHALQMKAIFAPNKRSKTNAKRAQRLVFCIIFSIIRHVKYKTVTPSQIGTTEGQLDKVIYRGCFAPKNIDRIGHKILKANRSISLIHHYFNFNLLTAPIPRERRMLTVTGRGIRGSQSHMNPKLQ